MNAEPKALSALAASPAPPPGTEPEADNSNRHPGTQTRHGGLFKQKGSQFWYARWRVDGKLYVKSTGKTAKRDAEAQLAEMIAPYLVADRKALAQSVAAHIAGAEAELEQIAAEKSAVPLAQAWRKYLDAPNRPDTGAATLGQYECQFSRFDTWCAAQKPPVRFMAEVTEETAAAFVKNLVAEKRTPNTINKYLNLLQLVWRTLAKPARLAVNPWAGIQRKTLAPVGRRELTLAELSKACKAATGELQILLALGLFTGMRLGDCCSLRWGEVDLILGVIRKDTRKTGKPVQIPIHPELLAMLKQAEGGRAGEYVLPEYAAAYLKRNQTVVARIQKHFAECGIVTAAPAQKQRVRRGVEVGFHSLRHSFVSLCARAGVPLAAVQSIVGHSNPAMTRHYTHIGIEAARGAVAALPAVTSEAAQARPAPAPADALATIRRLAKGMTSDNWKTRRESILQAAALAGV